MVAESYFDYESRGETGKPLVLLEHWGDDAWEALLAYASRHRVLEGDYLLRDGSPDPRLYIVASGELEVLSGKRRRPLIAAVGPGGIVGEVRFFDSGPASADVRAARNTVVLGITREAFEAFAGHHPDLGRDLLFDLGRICSLRLRRMTSLALG